MGIKSRVPKKALDGGTSIRGRIAKLERALFLIPRLLSDIIDDRIEKALIAAGVLKESGEPKTYRDRLTGALKDIGFSKKAQDTTKNVALVFLLWAAPVFAQRPDVIVFVTDDQPEHEQQFMPLVNSLLGPPFGVRFRSAVSHAALCDPSRATIYSGRYAQHHGVVGNGQECDFEWQKSFPNWLHDAGYWTVQVGKDFAGSCWRAPITGVWDVFKNKLSHALDPERAAIAIAEIERAPAGKPLLLYVGFQTPHRPARPQPQDQGDFDWLPPRRPPSFNEADVSDKPDWVRRLRPMTAAEMDSVDAFYQRQVEALQAVDRAERDVLVALQARGTLANAIVIHISDHGYSLGENRWVDKRCAYRSCLRVPLLVRAPDADARVDYGSAVSLVDVAPTILDYANVTPPIALDGRSLRPLLRNASVVIWPNGTLHETGYNDDMREVSVRSKDWHYGEYATGERELFDLKADPWQLNNRANNPAYAAKRDSLAAVLDSLNAE